MADPVSPSEISSWWAILVSLVMGLVSLGVFKAKVATKADLQKSEDDMLARLYHKNGTSIYIPRAECEKSQTSCANRVCGKLEEIKTDMQRRHDEHLANEREHLALHRDIAIFTGAVQQFMENHKKEG